MLHIHRSERADGLVWGLRELLAEPLADPFTPEVIAVPTRGMERWLSQRLSAHLGATPGRGDGVCANVGFPFPARVIGRGVAAATGIDPDGDPWKPEHAVWPLLEVVEECAGEPWLHTLAAHLGLGTDPPDPIRRSRRLAVLRHVADLFDRYAIHRPETVVGWAAGRDDRWQAELWRRLRGRVALPGPAERLASACGRLREDGALLDLPERIVMFGFTRLPAGHLRVLAAMAAHRDVHLFLLHPSPALWDSVAASITSRPAVVRRTDDPTTELPAHPLLGSWGRDAREMQVVLAQTDAELRDHHHEVPEPPETLLGRIQADVRGDVRAAGPAPLNRSDRSLQIHACHGRARQVEVMRDAVLHALEEDESLEPRDVIVMCPDIETFAPLVHATFGAGEPSADPEEPDALPQELRPPELRVRLADRSLRQTNPVLGVLGYLLELADQRVTASQVLDLADREPVRRRFRFDDDDLERIQSWVSASGIRWGLDAAHRKPYKLDHLPTGTWRTGLDRLLLGVSMSEDGLRRFADVLPVDDVESGSIDLTGRFSELIARLNGALGEFAEPRPIRGWASVLADAAGALTATSERDAWQTTELARLLEAVVEESGGSATPIALAEIRTLLADRLRGRPTRANFRTGHLTICTLVPMRSVPHRVVCLLGLDDGVFPRKAPHDGDDLMLDDPRVGERDPRSEDLQLLLDALLAAGDRLIVTYTGNDERTNAPRPPAVPVSELLDVAEARTPGARDHVLVHHPLQPFDPKNFAPGELLHGTSWGFDRVTLAGAAALTGREDEPRPFLAAPLPPIDGGVIEVEDLVAFVSHPVRAFLGQRLGISARDYSSEVEDDLRVELDALQRWGVGDRILGALLGGASLEEARHAERTRGELPPGALGIPVVKEASNLAQTIADWALEFGRDLDSVDVRAELPGGRRLSGTVADVCGDVLRTATFSKLAPKHRLPAWIRLLALTAAWPERPWSAVTIGRYRKDEVVVARIAPLGEDADTRRATARDELAVLIDLYERGMREPLPLYCATSAAWAAGGDRRRRDAGQEWETAWEFPKEDAEEEHVLVLGERLSFDEILDEQPRGDEAGPGWDEDDDSRFGRYARRLWDGLLAREEFPCS